MKVVRYGQADDSNSRRIQSTRRQSNQWSPTLTSPAHPRELR